MGLFALLGLALLAPKELVLDGVPDVPARISERARQYADARGATLLDWAPDGKGILVATGFGAPAQAFFVAAPGADRRQVTFGTLEVGEARFDPQKGATGFLYRAGETIAWWDRTAGRSVPIAEGSAIAPTNHGGRWAFATAAGVVTMDGEAPDTLKLVKPAPGWTPVGWTPDDKLIVCAHDGTTSLVDPASGDVSPAPAVPAPRLGWDIEKVAVSPDGKWRAFLANESGASGLTLVPVAQPKKAKRIALPVGVAANLMFDRQSKRIAVTLSTAWSPADVWVADVATGKVVRWTTSEVGGLDTTAFVSPELVTVTSFDQKPIAAWYYEPKNAKGPAPIIISLHGGPDAQALAGWSPQIQYWTNELGAAVLAPNVRGSTGYGPDFTHLDDGGQREDAVKDVGAFLDWIATRPELDKGKVGVIGASYGGWLALATLATYAGRVRCGVAAAPITNFVTFLQRTEQNRKDQRRAEYGDERDPAIREVLLRLSPITTAGQIAAPLLVAAGQNDPRVPPTEGADLVKTLRKAGGTVWYLLAKDEGHGFQQPANRDFYVDAVDLFFEENLIP